MTINLPHAYPIEMIQLVIAIIGCVLNIMGLIETFRDWRVSKQFVISRPQKLIALSNIYWEIIRLTVQLLFVIIGVTSVYTPPPPPSDPATELGSTIIRTCLVLATCLLAFKSMLSRRERLLLLELWLKEFTDRRKMNVVMSPDRRERRRRKDETGDIA